MKIKEIATKGVLAPSWIRQWVQKTPEPLLPATTNLYYAKGDTNALGTRANLRVSVLSMKLQSII